MVKPITELEVKLANDKLGNCYQNTLRLLDDALQTMEVNNQKDEVKQMISALLAAAHIVETVGNFYLQKPTYPLV